MFSSWLLFIYVLFFLIFDLSPTYGRTRPMASDRGESALFFIFAFSCIHIKSLIPSNGMEYTQGTYLSCLNSTAAF